jgi:hypothetical protein
LSCLRYGLVSGGGGDAPVLVGFMGLLILFRITCGMFVHMVIVLSLFPLLYLLILLSMGHVFAFAL